MRDRRGMSLLGLGLGTLFDKAAACVIIGLGVALALDAVMGWRRKGAE